jgi:hypothetical protein
LSKCRWETGRKLQLIRRSAGRRPARKQSFWIALPNALSNLNAPSNPFLSAENCSFIMVNSSRPRCGLRTELSLGAPVRPASVNHRESQRRRLLQLCVWPRCGPCASRIVGSLKEGDRLDRVLVFGPVAARMNRLSNADGLTAEFRPFAIVSYGPELEHRIVV